MVVVLLFEVTVWVVDSSEALEVSSVDVMLVVDVIILSCMMGIEFIRAGWMFVVGVMIL